VKKLSNSSHAAIGRLTITPPEMTNKVTIEQEVNESHAALDKLVKTRPGKSSKNEEARAEYQEQHSALWDAHMRRYWGDPLTRQRRSLGTRKSRQTLKLKLKRKRKRNA
jgi:hypothetical protein